MCNENFRAFLRFDRMIIDTSNFSPPRRSVTGTDDTPPSKCNRVVPPPDIDVKTTIGFYALPASY